MTAPVSSAPVCLLLLRTYTTLISNVKGKGRLQQVVDWCGGPAFDGCIVFDECHKAKNFVPGKEAQSTKVSPCQSTETAHLSLPGFLKLAQVCHDIAIFMTITPPHCQKRDLVYPTNSV